MSHSSARQNTKHTDTTLQLLTLMTAFLSSFPYRRWQRRHNQREPNLWWSEWFFLIPFNVACDARLWKCEAVRLWIIDQNHTLRWYGYFRRNEFIAVRDEQRQPQFASKACMKRRTNRTISVVAEAKPNKFRNYIWSALAVYRSVHDIGYEYPNGFVIRWLLISD